MTKIPLRVYNSEIDKLIDNKQSPEAIAHCKHILKYFPKHIDTYRLLGKAYLEMQRYSEASDILQRVLSVIPDDFIAQIGMSVVREDEGNLDASLYHMERAFEVQPANPAIQDELRRVYGRRDGVEPPKIRLTRGALVRLYTRGELYQQAIAEAKAALAEDPQRIDLQVSLARLYYLSGQKVQAAEVSSKLVSQLPYCLEANRILADVLPGSSRADDAKMYQDRVAALDPYAAMIGEHAKTSQEVPDNAVQIDRLEYQPGQDDGEQPAWTRTVGVEWDSEPASNTLPDWVSGEDTVQSSAELETETQDQLVVPGLPLSNETEIPDWMAAAGWSPSEGIETPPPPFADSDDADSDLSSTEDLVAPAEIPDWLQAFSPEAASGSEGETAAEDTAWLDGLLGKSEPEIVSEHELVEPEQVENDENLPDWLSATPEEIAEPAAQAEIPEWLQTEDQAHALEDVSVEEEPAEIASEIVSPEIQAAEPPLTEAITAVETEEIQPEEGLTAEAIQQPEDDMDAALAWLESLAAKQGADEATLATPPDERSSEIPDWLKQDTAAELPSVEELELSVAAGESTEAESTAEPLSPAVMTDISDLSAEMEISPTFEHPEIPDAALTIEPTPEPAGEEITASAPPVSQIDLQQIEDEYESILPEDVLAVEQPENAGAASPTDENIEDPFAWLESLAARQGADESTLLVSAEERPSTPPDWVMEVEETSSDIIEETTKPVLEQPTETPPLESEASQPPTETELPLPDWLQDVDEYTRVEREITPDAQSEENLPDWLRGLENMVEDEEDEVSTAQSDTGWTPEEPFEETPPSPAAVEEIEAALQDLEAQTKAETQPMPAPEVVDTQPVPTQPAYHEMVETLPSSDLLQNAQQALSKGEIETALGYFNRLINENSFLEETIHDLRDASYRYPVNSDIWQALGDAYSRSNRIQEALDAYTKAEELFR